MSEPTPRTDANIAGVRVIWHDGKRCKRDVVDADFARNLERALAPERTITGDEHGKA